MLNRMRSKETDEILPSAALESPKKDETEYLNAVRNTLLNVCLAIFFGVGVWVYKGKESGLSYFAGYAVEQSLSVDNLFVFLMLFNYFKIPLKYQNRVLSYGIYGAVIMRGIMIWIGVELIHTFKWVSLLFAAILLVSAVKMVREDADSEDDLSENAIMKLSNRFIKSTTEFDGERFFTTYNRERIATPLFMCLICVELSDLVFAIDSIPAAIGVSHDPFIVYSSNVFAILGLRSLYTLIAKAVADLPYLKPAVALVLGFVGLKMLGEYFQYTIPTGISLLVVVVLLSGGIILSLAKIRLRKGVDPYSGHKVNSLDE